MGDKLILKVGGEVAWGGGGIVPDVKANADPSFEMV